MNRYKVVGRQLFGGRFSGDELANETSEMYVFISVLLGPSDGLTGLFDGLTKPLFLDPDRTTVTVSRHGSLRHRPYADGSGKP